MKLRVFFYKLLFGNGQAYNGPFHWLVADWLACKPNGMPNKKYPEFLKVLKGA